MFVSIVADNRVKDVTAKYASGWMAATRKLRVVEDWWQETLKPFKPYKTDRDENEDLQLYGKSSRMGMYNPFKLQPLMWSHDVKLYPINNLSSYS